MHALTRAVVILAVTASAAAMPVISPVRVLTPQVPCYGRLECAADITGNWQNPFDPGQVEVEAEFAAPDGTRVRVPGFWYQDYSETPVTTRYGQQVEFLKFFLNEKKWIAGTAVELFVDDITLLDAAGGETRFDDMEQGEAPRARASGAPPLRFSTEVVHGDKRSLRFAPEPGSAEERWPAFVYDTQRSDWSGYAGMVLWVYPRCKTAMGAVQLYYSDADWGLSAIMAWSPGIGTLVPNRWNRLVWHWQAKPPPVRLTPQGKPEWRVRFTPTVTGAYTVRLSARDRDGETVSEEKGFTVTPSASHGFVRISRQDPHYFAFDDGTPFFPIGHDVPWSLADVRAYYPKMKAHGENATYFILFPSELSFEWDKLGEYNLERAAKMDRVLEAARDNGIYLKLSFDCHDNWRPSSQWGKSPYNARNGGPCETPNDLYTSPQAWDYYAKRTRYLSARWGYSPNLFAWEPIAELDGATQLDGREGWNYPSKPGGERISALVAPFLQKLAAHLDALDPYDRLFTTSFGGDVSDDRHWTLPEIAYLQIHSYDTADPSDTLSRWARDLTARYAKPMMITEFGWGWQGVSPGTDPEGINLHNGIWASVMAGAAGAAQNWWWEYIDSHDFYRHFPPLRAFVEGIDWPAEGFRPAEVAVRLPEPGKTMEVTSQITGQGGFGDVTEERYEVSPEGTLVGSRKPPLHLLARGRTEKRVSPCFRVNFPRPSTFAVEVAKVCPDARLEIRLDGNALRTVDLPCQNVPNKISTYDEKWQVWACLYDEAFVIDVPAGPHEVQVENTHPAGSWIQVSGYRFTRQEPLTLRALGLTGRSTTVVWVQNRGSMWYNWQKPAPEAVEAAEMTLRSLPAGKLQVEWMDTWSGRSLGTEQAEADRGVLRVKIPPVSRDVACRVRR